MVKTGSFFLGSFFIDFCYSDPSTSCLEWSGTPLCHFWIHIWRVWSILSVTRRLSAVAFTVHRKTDLLRIPAVASLHSSSPASPMAFLICTFVFLFSLVHCTADIFHLEWSFKFELLLHEHVLWGGGECLYIVKWWTIVYLLFVYSRFIYEKKWVYSINLYRLKHYYRISYADVENVNEHHVLSFVTDAYVFSGFLLVVFSNSALMTGFCLFSFRRRPLGRRFSCGCCRRSTSAFCVSEWRNTPAGW